MVHCHLIYGLAAWGKSKSLDTVFKLQKRAIRSINNKSYRAHTEPLFKSNTILTRQSEMADLARRATRWVGTLSDGNVHVKFHDDRLRNGGDITY